MTILASAHAAEIPFESNSVTPEGWRLYDDVEMLELPDPEWLIDGVSPRRGIEITYGPPGSCKTTLEASREVAIATGRSWFGHTIARPGLCVYIGGEDPAGWKLRVSAVKRAAGLSLDRSIGVYCFPEPIDLRDATSVARFCRFVKQADVHPVRICFDTFAANTPGAMENSSEDMTAAIAGAQKVVSEFDCNVTIIHHSNASGTRERGHSAMRGAADAMLSLTPVDDVIHVECSKMRNGPPFAPVVLKLLPLDTGGCVLRLASDVLPDTGLTSAQARILAILRDTFSADGATKSEWQRSCPDVPERTFHRVSKILEERRLIIKSGTHFRAAVTR